MVERRNINKITDKYSSKNVPVPTQILNIKVLSPAHQKMAHKYRHNLFSQFLNHRHQPLQFRFLNRLFLLIRFLLESQVLHHNLLRRLLRHNTQICHNRAVQLHLLKPHQLLRVYKPLSKLLDNRVRLPSQQLQTSSNSPRFQWFAVSTRGFYSLLVKEPITRAAQDKVNHPMGRMADLKVLQAWTPTRPWVKLDVYATKTQTAITTQIVFSTSHIIIT